MCYLDREIFYGYPVKGLYFVFGQTQMLQRNLHNLCKEATQGVRRGGIDRTFCVINHLRTQTTELISSILQDRRHVHMQECYQTLCHVKCMHVHVLKLSMAG